MKYSNIFLMILPIYAMSIDLAFSYSFKHTLAVGMSIFLLYLLSLIQKYIFVVFYLISLIVNTIMLHIVIHWGSIKGLMSRFEVFLLSPKTETIEYLKNFIGLMDGIEILYLLIGILLLFKYLKKTTNKVNLSILGIFIIIYGLLFYFKLDTKIIPIKFCYQYNDIQNILSKIKNRDNYIRNSKDKINKLQLKSIYDHIIITIGESANRNHLKIYGYKYNTTPFLNNLNKKYIFNAIAPTNQTRYSIPCDLTKASPNNFNLFFKTYSIISILNKNFITYWISNQFKVGKYDSYVASIANEAQYVDIQNLDYGVSDKVAYDSILVSKLKNAIDKNKKQVFFIHLMGSHSYYKDRYPQDKVLFENPKSIIQEYDNSIFYTDYILSEFFNIIKNNSKNFLFIYFSDHGEVVSKNKNGHGFLPPFKDEYEIPFVVFSSVANKNIVNLKKQNMQCNINMSELYYLLKSFIYNISLKKDICDKNNSYILAVEPENIYKYENLKVYK